MLRYAGLLIALCCAGLGCDDGASDTDAGAPDMRAGAGGGVGGAGGVGGSAEIDMQTGDGGAGGALDMALPDMPSTPHPGLLDPSQAQAEAPATFAVRFKTTAGDFEVDVTRSWAPQGADRFYNLVRIGYYDDVAFFRVLDGFMAQTGINGDPAVNAAWSQARISDDPVAESNTPGRVTFATAGPNTRTTQIFFNFGDNAFLDGQGFAPFGMVRDMTTLNAVYAGYGEGAPQGNGPDQGRIQAEGNAYLRADFPELDYIERATIIE